MFRKTVPRDDRHDAALIVPAALFFLYFLVVHFGALEGHPLPAVLMLIGVLAAGAYPGIRRGDKSAWMLVSISLAAGISLWISGHLTLLFYLPSLLVNLVLLAVFGVSLLPGNTPLITQFSRIMKGDLDAKALRYTYRVTQAWVLFLALLLAETMLLALFAPPWVWSVFANFLNYLLILLFFVVEYRVRVKLFPEVEHPGFLGFVRDLLRLNRRHIRVGFGRETGLSQEGERG